ncbi:DUF6463 family protein [Reinekea sp.]|jgi:hypothetical protein|uniref:DUF6463 family protein n=1 Tax=Reinekea sp. TaxID=1970455 RepID=UPI003988F0E7
MTQHHYARVLLFISLGHLFVGVLLFYSVFIDIWQQGWINVVGPNFLLGSAAVWFMLFAWPLLLIVIQFWQQHVNLSRAFVIVATIGSIVGVSLMPASGFWLMLVLNVYALAKLKVNANTLKKA